MRHAKEGKEKREAASQETNVSPGIGAIGEQSFEVFPGDEFAAVHPRLNGPESSEDTDLLHSTHHGGYVQSLQLCVHRVQSSHQVLEEKIKDLRQADQFLAVHQERSHLHPVHVDHPALVGVGVGVSVAAATAATTSPATPGIAVVVIGHKTVDHTRG